MSEILGEGKHLRLLREGRWEYVERLNTTGIVIIVAVTEAGELVCIDQKRAAVGRRVLELPAGLAGDEGEETLENAARRELLEETGFSADRFVRLGEAAPSPGLSTEIVTYFRATGLSRVGPGGGDETEDIEVCLVPLGEVKEWIADRTRGGALVDEKLYTGLYFVGENG